MNKVARICLVLTFALFCAQAWAQSADATRKTIWSGVFNEEQLARGAKAYNGTCARCHLEDLSGKNGPTLKGDRFMEDWREANLNILFNTVKSMPPQNGNNAPVRLPEPMYLDILTYLLSGNGAPTGPQELTIDALPTVQFEKKTGPEPVPNLALVGVVGCLTQPTPTTWVLTSATDPVRVMAPDEVLPAEAKAAAAQALGAKSYRLNEVDRLTSPIDEAKGQKVQVKGNLVRQSDKTERLNISALAGVGSTCP
jgi:cytochrome c553